MVVVEVEVDPLPLPVARPEVLVVVVNDNLWRHGSNGRKGGNTSVVWCWHVVALAIVGCC